MLIIFNSFVTLASTRLRHAEGNADASKHVGMLTKYYWYTHICVCVLCICWCR